MPEDATYDFSGSSFIIKQRLSNNLQETMTKMKSNWKIKRNDFQIKTLI